MKFLALLLLLPCAAAAQLVNPLLPSGPDPYVCYKDGYYYYTNTLGSRVDLWKTRDLKDLKTAQRVTIFKPEPGKPYSRDVWAPEVMFLRGKWYAYVAADDGNNDHHRIFVLENANPDPMQGAWTFKGEVANDDNKWAIDADVIDYKGRLYMAWSGWEGDTNGEQDIYIARMSNPWTIEGQRVRISRPTYSWETHGDLKGPPGHLNVNEGPQFLIHKDRVFIVFSASACWTDHYALGLLSLSGHHLLDAGRWHKSPEPVFTGDTAVHVYAPGHNSFYKDGQGRDWLLYHANNAPDLGCGGRRSPRAQPFTWNADGTPDFGRPVAEGPLANP
ncbi:MAG TPA: glycoside hydrolase family 43 protein [Dinghuibacter sp.]|uniref:glycoside hydrolase family 43 protein n=1 Tax=Dinghuibacter sp. TaxID=2024697 RepID=UPI002C021516|nr:glycoside hydrolase family 43 protein [Dinghuibacter sp.]HTJ12065.1 glycoside hydrolase family 43 protein [Dinghuibacter sp.]